MEGKTTNFEKRDIFRHKLTYHEKIESLKQVQPEIDERKWKKNHDKFSYMNLCWAIVYHDAFE